MSSPHSRRGRTPVLACHPRRGAGAGAQEGIEMMRRAGMAMATAMLVAASLVGTAGSAGAAPRVSGTGYLACAATTGKIKVSPGLGTAAAAGLRTFTAKLTFACDGGSNPAFSVNSA